MWSYSRRRVAVALLALSLAGCGFQLRGQASLPEVMARTYIETDDTFSEFYRRLKQALSSAGVEVIKQRDAASAVIHIRTDHTGQRVLSVSARNLPREYEVYYTISFSVVAGDEVLIEAQTVTLTRDYTYDETMVLGKSEEVQVLRQAIARDLVQLVTRQLTSVE